MNYCLKNGRLIDPAAGRDRSLDILVIDGKISRVGPALAESAAAAGYEIIDASPYLVLPGLIDLHVHLREPGEEEKETIASGTRAAVKGGFTSVVAMPNTKPPADNGSVLTYIRAKAAEAKAARVYPVGNITKGGKGLELAEMGELVANGAVAFSDDGRPVMNADLARNAFRYGRLFGKPFLLHCEEENLSAGGQMHEGFASTRLGLKGYPSVAEEAMVARDLLLAEDTGARIHIQHLSSKRSVELIREAKRRGVKVTAEVTPHHLVLTDEDVADYHTATKVNPPLRTKEDREALREGLLDGTIDLIATDHAPHTREEKNQEFGRAPFGMTGLETALGLIFTEFYHTGLLSLAKIVDLLSLSPARLLGIPGGTLAEGSPADLILVDPDREWEVKEEEFASKSVNSPFIGWKLKGKAVATMVGGEWVYKEI
ncbi:MAG: dihydroorotase [Firmicutes bacterium]|nr:dihydroorotase [Bacillota bacterium]